MENLNLYKYSCINMAIQIKNETTKYLTRFVKFKNKLFEAINNLPYQ